MNRADELERENGTLRGRLSRLSEAKLLINESVDFETVLQGVLDSARSLTGSRYGVILVLDTSGQVQDYLSSGMTADESRQLSELHAMPIVERICTSSGPVRLRDFYSNFCSLGLPQYSTPIPLSPGIPFMAAPVQHRDETVANFYLADKKEGEEFTPEDEETLIMLASLSAVVIANARRHRDDQRARADLEALVNTAPVGLLVFDAKTGAAMSANREARRITCDLHESDRKVRKVLDELTVRRADGREVSLAEFPLAQALQVGETVRAEEVVLRTPDGRSLTALVNATPILSEEAGVESVVVTLQDMTPLEELERLRAEFLAMVSHELRTPLTSVKGSITTLLDPSTSLNPAETLQFHQIIDAQTDRMRELIADLLDVARIESGTLSVFPKPTEVAVLVDEANIVFQSGGGKHNLHIDLDPGLLLIMADRLRMIQVLSNLLSNAAKHSPETLPIRVSASREGRLVVISVSDKGRGIPAASLPHLFRKFSRIDAEDQGDGTGLGLAICKGIVEAHGGRIWAESDGSGLGTTITFTVPNVEQPEKVSPTKPTQPSTRSSPQALKDRLRILAVDDDLLALRYVRDALSKAGYMPIVTGNPEEALALMYEKKPHLALLDLMLPGTDGIELMKEILEIGEVPVIFLSAYAQDHFIARAIDMGAADYVVKPFSPTELTARIRGALRKWTGPDPLEPFVLGELVIDYVTRQVTLASERVRLTAIEYRTLVELSLNSGRVLTYEYLLEKVWDVEGYGDLRPMRTVISTLRRRLGDDADNPIYIFTEPRVGYRMARADSSGNGTARITLNRCQHMTYT